MASVEPSSETEHQQTERTMDGLATLLPAGWPLDIPLVRLHTCGCSPLSIEVLSGFADPERYHGPRFAPPSEHAWQTVKGRRTALALLSFLVSQPRCFASQDALSQALRPGRGAEEALSEEELDISEDRSLKRVDNLVTDLRRLLYPPALACLPELSQRALRKMVIRRVKASRTSGLGYALAPLPLVWLDVEVMEWHAKQAQVLEQFGEPVLDHWRSVSEIGVRGGFLPHERYSDWAMWRHARVRELLWQSVEAQLKGISQWEDQEAGEEVALRLLSDCWQAEPGNEDIFRALAEKLARRERFQQAEDMYQQLCLALEREGHVPHDRTEKVMEFVRTKMITRKQTPIAESLFQRHVFAHSTSTLWTAPSPFREPPHPLSSGGEESSVLFPITLQTDTNVLERLSMTLSKPTIMLEREIAYFDQQTRLYWRAREETAQPTLSLYTAVIRHLDDLHLLFARSHLPQIRQYLCEIVCRTILLAGILLYDQGHYVKARQTYHMAFQAATEANNPVLQAIVWGWMSFTWTYERYYKKALTAIQYARFLAKQTSDQLIQAWLGAVEAEIQAHLSNREECLQALQDMERGNGILPTPEASYLFEFNTVLLLGYKGVCLQQLYLRQNTATHDFLRGAREALEYALESEAPLKRKLYYLTDLASVYARQGEVEAACSYLVQSLPLMKQVGSGSETVRKHLEQARTLLEPYKQATAVQDVDAQMIPLLQGMHVNAIEQ
jgi:tetratricopeptide (TPR) repeat protein